MKDSLAKDSVGKSLHILNSTNITRCKELLCVTGFHEGSYPFCYLGVPTVSNQLKVVQLDDLVHKICDRNGGWKPKLSSQGACLTLIRKILMILPIHLLSCKQVPKAILQRIN